MRLYLWTCDAVVRRYTGARHCDARAGVFTYSDAPQCEAGFDTGFPS